jgi:hypothetical protein
LTHLYELLHNYRSIFFAKSRKIIYLIKLIEYDSITRINYQ